MNPIAFSLDDVTKSFLSARGGPVQAVDGVSFNAISGAVTCLLGPTGAGKSTVLRILAGLEIPEHGKAMVMGAAPSAGGIGYMTQHDTLLPWRNVADNIALPLELRGVSRKDRMERAEEIARKLGLEDALARYPHELSAGMRQRASLGRLLCMQATLWFMDEPFSSLDERTQHRLERLLLELRDEYKLSVLFVTHSIDEAVFVADRIVMLSTGPGRVVESFDIGLPHPRDRFSDEYGRLMERLRRGLEGLLRE